MTLPEFLRSTEIGRLTAEERQLIVAQALLLLEHNYALLPFKVARYGINPLQRLRLLQARGAASEWAFHAELVDIFNSLRDLHTRYVLPLPFAAGVATLPFLLKEFTEDKRRRYLVGRRTAGDLGDPTFRFGVEVTHWNGVPIARAVERFADAFPGANPEARHARAVDRFTFRSLAFGPPPDEDWITIDYLDLTGTPRQIRQEWDVRSLVPEAEVSGAEMGIDVEGDRLARLRTELFAPEFIVAERSGEPVDAAITVSPAWSTVFEARPGHLRIRTFKTQDVIGFVQEFVGLLGQLPPDGLVLDIRGNPGGAIVAAELCLQALTARPVEPEPAQFAATPLNLRICRANDSMADWLPSMEQALETGAAYSAAVPFTPADLLAEVPQAYFGPVVLITDARCYSASDIFAAGFQDNLIGQILGTDGNTGAGGGNVWNLALLLGSLPAADFPFRPLPDGADLSIVIRRVLRVGANAGTPLEDYGVVPNERHVTTRADVMSNDVDLLSAAAALLTEGTPRRFDVTLSEAGGELTATFAVLGIDRADVTVDGRPRLTVDLGANPAPAVVPEAGPAQEVRVTGYDGGKPVAVRRFTRTDAGLTLRTTFTP